MPHANLETAHANMVEQQIRPWNVLDTQTLTSLKTIPRECFVPKRYHALAFADMQIPLGNGEFMLEPKLSARLVEAMGLGAQQRVLEIGSGSGYTTALLASLCSHVTGVEIHPRLLELAQQNLAQAGVENVSLEQGDAHAGWHGSKVFDAILIGGSLPVIEPEAWTKNLREGGRLVGIEGHLPAMQAVRFTKNDTKMTRESLFETVVPRLLCAEDAHLRAVETPPQFEF